MSVKKTVNLLSDAECFPVGCRICGGELIPALGPAAFAVLPVNGIPKCVGYSQALKSLFVGTGNNFLSLPDGESFKTVSTIIFGNTFFLDYLDENRNPHIGVYDQAFYFDYDGETVTYQRTPAILRCGVMHCGRIFGAGLNDGFKLYWSGEGGVWDWKQKINGSGNLTLDSARGEVLDLVEYGEKIVAVRKYGLTVLSMFGSPENFSVEFTDTDSDEIYKDTARVVCGKLVFCSVTGLHYFDGSAIKRLNHRLERDISAPVCSMEYGGKYFLSCTSKDLNRKAVLCCDPVDGESYYIGVNVDKMCSGNKRYAFYQKRCYTLEEGGSYSLKSSGVNFGSERMKTVTEVYIDGEVSFEISNGNISRTFRNVKGIVRPRLRGKNFSFNFTGATPVRAITVTAEECNAI